MSDSEGNYEGNSDREDDERRDSSQYGDQESQQDSPSHKSIHNSTDQQEQQDSESAGSYDGYQGEHCLKIMLQNEDLHEKYSSEEREQPNTERITSPYLSKYEKARVLGLRALQISQNSPLYAQLEKEQRMALDPLAIAQIELQEHKLPLIVRRYLPNGEFEDWKVSQLKMCE